MEDYLTKIKSTKSLFLAALSAFLALMMLRVFWPTVDIVFSLSGWTPMTQAAATLGMWLVIFFVFLMMFSHYLPSFIKRKAGGN